METLLKGCAKANFRPCENFIVFDDCREAQDSPAITSFGVNRAIEARFSEVKRQTSVLAYPGRELFDGLFTRKVHRNWEEIHL